MTLDKYRYSEPAASTLCSDCDTETDCLAFWEEAKSDGPADVALCLSCLFEAKDRFEHKTPAQVLQAYETIEAVEEREDAVIVTAQSQLGTVHYLHHAETTFNVVDKSITRDKKKICLRESRKLTGAAEAFEASEDFLAPVSTYGAIAADHLSA